MKLDLGYCRSDKKGGGIALIYNTDSVSISNINIGKYESFEFSIWRINDQKFVWHLIGIYHPSSSTLNISDITFLDQLSEFIGEIRIKYQDFIITGDFNMHVNNLQEAIADEFIQLIQVHGLIQLVDFPTHQNGNTLDLVLTNFQNNIEIESVSRRSVFLRSSYNSYKV